METMNNMSGLGYFVNFLPADDPDEFSGGIAYSEHVDTIRGFYKASIQPRDTAWLLVWFKKNGNVIGGGIYPFTPADNVSSWTPFVFSTNMPSGEVPDTLMFGAASGNFRSDSLILGSRFALDGITFIANGIPVARQASNHNFENWDIYEVQKPDGLFSSLSYCINTDPLPVEKINTASDGSLAVKLTTVLNAMQDTTAGFVTNGIMHDGWPPLGGDTLYETPVAVSYDYISNIHNDQAYVNFYFKRNGQVIEETGRSYDTVSASVYTHERLPLSLSQTPDAIVYTLYSGENPGSQLIIDNIMLEYAAAVDNHTKVFRMETFPNPVNDILHFRIQSESPGRLRLFIYDASGKQVKERSFSYPAGNSRWDLRLSGLPAGIYVYRIMMNGKTNEHRFIKR